MKKGFLLSDHLALNDLYYYNLRAYIDLDLQVSGSLEELLTLLDKGDSLDIIISLSHINGEDCPLLIQEKIEELGLDVVLLIIGERSKLSRHKKVYTLGPNLNIPMAVRTCAKILGVTAKEMALKEVDEFFPLSLSLFRKFKKTPCPLFIKIGHKGPYQYSQCLKEGDTLYPSKKIDFYANTGVLNLYIPSKRRLEIINLATKVVMEELGDPHLSLQDRVLAAEQGHEVVGGILRENPKVTPELIEISRKCMESLTSIIRETPRLKELLSLMLENKTGYLYLRSVIGTYISRHIIQEMSWGSDEHAEKLSFVFFFHDIFLTPLYARISAFKNEETLLFEEIMSDKEKEIILNHARLASEMVKNFPRCPMGADAIILQHHGMSNGMGFALEYKDDISPLAKVLIISEAFSHEIIQKRNSSAPLNFGEIIETLRERFTKHTYKKIINCLESLSF